MLITPGSEKVNAPVPLLASGLWSLRIVADLFLLYLLSAIPMVQPPAKGLVAIPNTYFCRNVCLCQLLFCLFDLYKLHSWLVAQMPGKAV